MIPGHVNSLASGMIDKVRHSCKFKYFGCTIKECLNTLTKHERDCNHKTVFCPTCKKEVHLKNFYTHAKNSSPPCIDEKKRKTNLPLQRSNRNLDWKMGSFRKNDFVGERFYVTKRYFAKSKMFVINVALAYKLSIAERYLAKISIVGDTQPARQISMTTNVDTLDNVPENEEDFLNSANCWLIPIQQLTTIIKKTTQEVGKDSIQFGMTFSIKQKVDLEESSVQQSDIEDFEYLYSTNKPYDKVLRAAQFTTRLEI